MTISEGTTIRTRVRRLLSGVATAIALGAATLPLIVVGQASPAAAAGTALYGLRATGTSLVRFDSAAPGTGSVNIPITGLPGGEFLRGIDVRPADGQLYGYASDGSSYRINPYTGAATLTATSSTSIVVDMGYDFNPVSDRSREVASAGANIRTNPDVNGPASSDTAINPAGFSITGIAYTLGGATTTLYGIDVTGDRLVMVGGVGGTPSPNLGTATAVGPLAVNTTNDVGFDISPSGSAFASLTTGAVSSLYTINLTTGAATLVGAIPGAPLSGLAVGPLDPFTRLSGADRIDTSIATSTNSFPVAGSAPGAVLARNDVAADALSGTPLTKIVGGPLLLTPSGVLDGRTQTEMVRLLGPTGRTVHLLGGPVAISANVESQIEALGYNTVRHGGVDRYDTAVQIANAAGAPGTVFLADGQGFADALIAGVAAAKAGGVVLLTAGTTMPAVTNTYLTSHAGTRYTLGPASTAFAAGTVIAGADAFVRSASLATQFWPTSSAVIGVASGEEFPDGLTGGAHIARLGAPLLLTTSATGPVSVRNYLSANHLTIDRGFAYGGTLRISDAVFNNLRADIS